jgi:hypothetical protein
MLISRVPVEDVVSINIQREILFSNEVKKKTKNNTVGTFPKFNIKIIERGEIDTPSAQICCQLF